MLWTLGRSLGTTEMQLLSISSNSGSGASPRLSSSLVGPSLIAVGPSLHAAHHPVDTTTTMTTTTTTTTTTVTTTTAAAAAESDDDDDAVVLSSSDSDSDWDEWSDTKHLVFVLLHCGFV